MTRLVDVDCRPYVAPVVGVGTILELAARAGHAADEYRRLMDGRADYRVCIRAASVLARATGELVTAIADGVACGNNTLT